MAKTANKATDSKKLLKIRIVDCDLQGLTLKPLDEGELFPEKLVFNVKLALGFDRDNEMAQAIYHITGRKKSTDIEPLVSLKVSTHFKMSGLKELPYSEEKIDIPDWAMGTLINVSLGITRGVLVAETKGTPYSQVIIPITNIRDLAPSISAEENILNFGI